MIIPNITPLPPSPQRTDPSTFAARADASLTAQETVFTPELNAFASAVNVTQAEMTVLSDTATTQAQIATTQAAAAASSALSAGATVWVSGTTYTVGVSRYSPLNGQVYRRMVGGAGTTDPSLDAVNWRVVNGLTSELIDLPFNNLPSMRPSLNLDFAGNQTVDPRITFTRASTATRTNARGLIEAVPSGVPRIDFDAVTGGCKGLLIEEQRTNLLTYSEQFDNAAWTKTRATVTANTTTAPDGTLTADKLIEDTTASNSHDVRQYPTVSGAYTVSVFAKADTRSSIFVDMYDATNGTRQAVFNLSSGAVTFCTPTVASAQIQAVGNGWYRCSISVSAAATGGDLKVGIYNGSAIYTGDGTSGLFIWGAQLEAGAFPTTYQPSTETWTGRASTATFYGSNGLIQTASSGVARMNYNPMNLTVAPKLLLEAAGTNLLTYSEAFDNAGWVKVGGAAAASNTTLAPDGTTTADTLTVSSSKQVFQPAILQPAGTYCFSCFVKSTGASQVYIQLNVSGVVAASGIDINFTAKTVSVRFGSPVAFGVIDCGNGWLRPWVVLTSNATASVSGYIVSASASDETVFAWGAQLEASPYATSYIPTVASQVTRVADTSTSAQTTRAADVAKMTGANFSSWYRQDEGSFVVDTLLARQAAIAGTRQYTVSDGASSSIGSFYRGGGTTGATVIVSGVTQVDLAPTGVIAANTAAKISLAYKANDFSSSGNGATVVTDTSGTVPTLDRIYLGTDLGTSLNGHLRSLGYYPKRLTNAELQALSTQ